MYWELLEMFRKLAMAAIGEFASVRCPSWRERRSLLPVCAGVFAVDGAFNAAVTPDISGALAPVVQPFLGQLVTGALQGSRTVCRTYADAFSPHRSSVACTSALVPAV